MRISEFLVYEAADQIQLDCFHVGSIVQRAAVQAIDSILGCNVRYRDFHIKRSFPALSSTR